MQLDFVPVARMFFAGATLLVNSGCSVYPFFSIGNNNRVVVEAYPSLVARFIVSAKSYKTDNKKKQTKEQLKARQAIVGALEASVDSTSKIGNAYCTTVQFNDELRKSMIDDATGDTLDGCCALCLAGGLGELAACQRFRYRLELRFGRRMDRRAQGV